MEDKDLIILSVYINVKNLSRQQVQEKMTDLIVNYSRYFEGTNKNIKIMWFPVVDQDTRVECVYPPSVKTLDGKSENELINVYKLLVNLKNEEAKDIIRDIERKIKFKKIS